MQAPATSNSVACEGCVFTEIIFSLPEQDIMRMLETVLHRISSSSRYMITNHAYLQSSSMRSLGLHFLSIFTDKRYQIELLDIWKALRKRVMFLLYVYSPMNWPTMTPSLSRRALQKSFVNCGKSRKFRERRLSYIPLTSSFYKAQYKIQILCPLGKT